jgi:DNA-binding MarR family transcriptional regulator
MDGEGEIQVRHAPSQSPSYHFFVGSAFNDANLTVYEFRLYAFLACAADKDAGSSWWSIRKIAKKCNVSVGSIVKAAKSLKRLGFIDIEKRTAENGGRTSNIYYVKGFPNVAANHTPPVSPDERSVSPHEHPVSPHEHPVHQVVPILYPKKVNPEKGEGGAQARHGAKAPTPVPASLSSSSGIENDTKPLNGSGSGSGSGKPKKEPKPKPVLVPPALEEFGEYAVANKISSKDAVLQYEEWKAGDWHDGAGNKIYSWKQKLLAFRNGGHLPSQKRERNENSHTNNKREEFDEQHQNWLLTRCN